MSQRVLLVLMLVVGLVLAGLLATLVLLPRAATIQPNATAPSPADPLQPDEMLVGYVVPEFELVDHDDQLVDQTILEGRVTILAFMFTHCPFACPGLTGQMLTLQSALAGTGVRFLNISVDPDHDTPEVLRAYGERAGADFSRWRYLTGPAEVTRSIVRDSLNFHVGLDESRPIPLAEGTSMANINHPSHLILVGPDRQLLGIYLYSDTEAMAALRSRAFAADRALR